MLSGFLAKSLLVPGRHPFKKKPIDYGMQYSEFGFSSSDGIDLKGWHIAGTSKKLIIMTNPMPFSKYGFAADSQGLFKITEQDVELLLIAKHLNNAGYGVIIIDLRNHGNSGSSPNHFCTIGMEEWQDIAGLMKHIKSNKDYVYKTIGFMALCTGANAVIKAMSKSKELFTDVKCLFAVQPVSADILTKKILEDKYPLFRSFYDGINKKAKKKTGYSLEEMTPASYIQDIPVPVLYAQTQNDPWTIPADIEGFYNKTKTKKELIWLEGKERFDGYRHFGKHPEKMLEFFSHYL